jgi:CDP-glycerol glycerophosphotransferase
VNAKSLYSFLRAGLGALRRYRRLALKAIETYLPETLGYGLSKLVDPFFRLSALSATYSERLEIDPDLVMYESYNGRDFAGNSYALFRHLVDRPDYSRLRHVVVVPYRDHPKVRPWKGHPRVRFVEVDSAAYVRAAETCAYFINDASYKPYLVKRPGQTYVYTWHSTLLKKLAVDKGAPWEARNVTRALVTADYFISPNRFTTDILLRSHGARAFMDGRIAEFGYPRNDLTVNCDVAAVRRRLGAGDGERIALFAPTWRGEQNAENTVAETLEQRRILAERLGNGWRVVVKFHTMVYRFLDKRALSHCAPLEVDANELLAAADVLVTDYSGIFFDYLLTGRPIVFFTPDREAYAKAKNGFYLDLDTLPGPVYDDIALAAEAVLRTEERVPEFAARYAEFRSHFVADDDGNACRRTVDLVFGGIEDQRVYRLEHDKKRVLFYPGPLNPNGVTTSFLALTGALDYGRYDVAVLIPDEERNRVFQAGIDPRASVFYQSVPDAFTAAEYRDHARFVKRGSRFSSDLPTAAYRRTLGRILGAVEFDTAVNFHGYQPADAAKFALAVPARRRVVFLHNDLERDRRIKQPQLYSVFSTYKYYDALFCVSQDSLEANLAGMAAFVKATFGDEVASKMGYAHNLISPDRIRTLSVEPLPPSVPLPPADAPSFMTIGRLSPEKNHLRLLEAFSRVAAEYPAARLYIVGDGREARPLRSKAEALGLTDSVVFIPFMANPFPLYAACGCFVLSSDIEGQPVTVLEALTLDRPIIATDIAGPRDLLKGGEGRLVPPTAEALAQAMLEFAKNGADAARTRFDPYAYVAAAGRRFAEVVLEDAR